MLRQVLLLLSLSKLIIEVYYSFQMTKAKKKKELPLSIDHYSQLRLTKTILCTKTIQFSSCSDFSVHPHSY